MGRRIKDFEYTASAFSHDDYIAIDGETQGTRNMQYSTLVAEMSAAIGGGGGTTEVIQDKCIFVDPINGDDTKSGLTENESVATVSRAYALMESHDFDTFCVIGTEPNDPQASPVLVEIPAVPDTLQIDALNIVTKVSSKLTFASINTALNINAKSNVLKVFYGGTVTSNINITSDGNVELHNIEEDVESTTSNLQINAKGNVFLNCIPYEEGDYGCYPDSSAEYYDFYAQSVNVKANNIYACGCVKNGCDITFIADNDVYNLLELAYGESTEDDNWSNVTQNYYLEAGNSVCQLEDVVANTFIVKSKYYGYCDGSTVATGELTVKSRVDIRTINDTYIGSIKIGDITERGHVYIAGGFEQCVSDKAQFDQHGKSLNNPILQINGIISHYSNTASRNLHEYAPVVFIDWKGLIEHNGTAIYAQQYKEKSLGYTTNSVLSGLYISGLDHFQDVDGVDTPIYHNYPVEIYSEGTLRNLKIYTGIDDASQKWIPVHIKCKNLDTDGVAGVGGIEICSHDIVIDAEDSIISSGQATYFLPKPGNYYDTDNGYIAPYISTDTDTESSVIVRAKRNITIIPPTLSEAYTCNQVFTVNAGEEVRLNNFGDFGTRICAKIINIKARKLSGNFDNFCAEFHVDVDMFETIGSYFKVYGYLGVNDKWAHLGTTQSTFNAKTVIMLNDADEGKPISGIFDFGMNSANVTEVRNLDIHIDTIVCSFNWTTGIYCPILTQFFDYKGEISGEIGCIVNTYGNKIHKVSRWQKDLTFVVPQPNDIAESVIVTWDVSARVSLHFAERSTPFDIYIDPNQGDDRYDGLTASTPVKTRIGLYRTLKTNFPLTVDTTNHKISTTEPITLHMLSGSTTSNRASDTSLEFVIASNEVDDSSLSGIYDLYFNYLEIVPEEPNLGISLKYLNSCVLQIRDFYNVEIIGLYGNSGCCSIQSSNQLTINNASGGTSPGGNYTYYDSRPFGYLILDSAYIKITGMFNSLYATAKSNIYVYDSTGAPQSSTDNCCLLGNCNLICDGDIELGSSNSNIGLTGNVYVQATKVVKVYVDSVINCYANINGANIYCTQCASYMSYSTMRLNASDTIYLTGNNFNGTTSFNGNRVELISQKSIRSNSTATCYFYKTDAIIKTRDLCYMGLYFFHNANSSSVIEADYIQYAPIQYRLGTLSIKTNRMISSQITRMTGGPSQLESNNYTENLYLDIKTLELNCSLPLTDNATGGQVNVYANIDSSTVPFIGWSGDPSGVTAGVIYNFNVTIGHSRYQNPAQAISYQGDTLPANATGKILVLNRDIVKDEGLQSVTKTATVSAGVATVTLDNDKYNIIQSISSAATDLIINVPESLTKVQECGFEFVVDNVPSLSAVNAYTHGRHLPVKAPTVFDASKLYQGTSLNNVIVIAEFDYYPIIITNIEATNDTSSSIDINVTGTNVTNNLEYTLSLTLDGVETKIAAIGTTVTLTGTQYTAYSNATDVAALVMLDGKSYTAFKLKGNPLVLDGRLYKTVTIGNQTWMAENLDYKFNGLQLNNSSWSYSAKQADYYDKDEVTYGVNGNKYGLLYNFVAAKYLNNNKSTLTPGWHVPTLEEWNTLITYAGGSNVAGSKLKSTTGWASGPSGSEGTDNYGFNAKPAGQGNEMNNAITFVDVSYKANFLTSTADSTNPDYQCNVISMYNSGTLTQVVNPGNNYPFSIRLIKD